MQHESYTTYLYARGTLGTAILLRRAKTRRAIVCRVKAGTLKLRASRLFFALI